MTMPTFEDGMPQSLFNLTGLAVARWDGSNYGQRVFLTEGQTFKVTVESDTHNKMSYGYDARRLTIPVRTSFNLGIGLLQPNALWVMTSLEQAVSGTSGSPTATQRLRLQFGGAGLPYFGIIGNFASDDGGQAVLGVPLCKLDTIPSLSSEQNQFIMPESAGKGMPNRISSYPRAGLFIDQQKVVADVLDFDAFFGIS